jgi:hypothetical protein
MRDILPYVALATTVGGFCVVGLATLGAALACGLITTNLALYAAQRLWGDV